MKFCMVTTFYPPYHFGGDATYVRALAEGLVERGHEVTVVHCEDAYRLQAGNTSVDQAGDSAVTVHRLKSRAGFLSPLVTQQLGVPGLKHARLRDILAQPFDVVNFHNISLIGGPAVLALSRAAVTLYTLHEHWLLCATHIFWQNRRQPCEKRRCVSCSVRSGIPPQWWRYTGLIERSLEHVDCLIAPSQYTAQRHQALLDLPKPVEVLPLFANLQLPEDSSEGNSKSPAQTHGHFLYVGRLTAAKGVEPLLQQFSQWPQYQLTVVGDGPQRDELEARYGGYTHIRFTGPVPQQSLVSLYRQATALIMPSLAPETFGLTIVEAFACGTPAIVRSAGGNRETIDISGAGMVYSDERELSDALAAFSADETLRDTLSTKALQAYQAHYTKRRHLDRYLALVEQTRESKLGASAM